jgi:hypothetical protein
MSKVLLFSCGLLGIFASACGGSSSGSDAEDSQNASAATVIHFDVQETEASASGSTYTKSIIVTASAPIKPALVTAAIFRSTATGSHGLCPSCTADTPEAEQNDGHGRIHADNMMPHDFDLLPSFLAGDVSCTQTADGGHVLMNSLTNSLDATISVRALSPKQVRVDELGRTGGVFPETFGELHNKFFDLRSAIERELAPKR